MATHYTPILTGAAATAALFNSRLQELDNALIALTSDERLFINVRAPRFGAMGDGVTDDAAALDAALTEANAVSYGSGTVTRGAVVYFPPGLYAVSRTLVAPTSGVRLLGTNFNWGSGFWSASTIKATFTNAFPLFDLGSSGNDITFEKLTLAGSTGTSLLNRAIYGASVSDLSIIDCNFHGWGGSAIRIDAGQNKFLYRNQVTGSMLAYAALADRRGVVELHGTENYLAENNINGPGPFTTTVAGEYGSGYLYAIVITGSPVRSYHNVGAFCQNGWLLSGTSAPSVHAGDRGEFIQGTGFVVEGSRHKFFGPTAFQVGLDADNTYYGFKFTTSGCIANELIAPELDAQTGVNKAAGLLLDDVSSGDTWQRSNKVISPNIGFNNYAGTNGWVNKSGNTPLVVAGGVPYHQTLTDGATVNINAALGDYWDVALGGSRTIAAPTKGYKGQRALFALKNNTAGAVTTTFNGAFKLAGWTDPAAGKTRVLELECYDGTNWRQTSAGTGDLTI